MLPSVGSQRVGHDRVTEQQSLVYDKGSGIFFTWSLVSFIHSFIHQSQATRCWGCSSCEQRGPEWVHHLGTPKPEPWADPSRSFPGLSFLPPDLSLATQ